MFYYFFNRNKTIKELRKNAGYTANELAIKARCESIDIKRIDNKKLKDIDERLKEKLLPIFRGDRYDKVPW